MAPIYREPDWLTKNTGRMALDKTPWMDVARKEIGVEEPDSLKYFDATDYDDPGGRTPYCAAFANWCLKQVGIKGSGHADAVSFAKWGKDVSDDMPVGAVVVFRWSTGQHHVSFFSGPGQYEGEGMFLGGNQTSEHEVCEESLPLGRAIAWRWPA